MRSVIISGFPTTICRYELHPLKPACFTWCVRPLAILLPTPYNESMSWPKSSLTSPLVVTAAFAGHAGDMDNPGAPVVLPVELWLGVMGIAVLVLIAVAWLAVNAARLRKIDRRLSLLERKQKE
jgi:hypothetical protein